MNSITHSEIGPGSDVCPSCKSDNWKSARMVIMEGTTSTTGTLDGTITDPGKLSGGLRNFLLSDRWFSWDYPIEAEIGLTSSTGLVEEVKRLMVHYSSKVQMPSPSAEPKKVGAVKKEWNALSKPIRPEEPEWPVKPEKPMTTIFSFNKRLKNEVYEGKLKRRPYEIEKYKKDKVIYRKDKVKYYKAYIPRLWFGAFPDFIGFIFFSAKSNNHFQIYPGTPVWSCEYQ
jgi:hypothetical protein